MEKRKIEQKIAELKMDYINLQHDLEKFESVGQNHQVEKAEERLANMEKTLALLNATLDSFN